MIVLPTLSRFIAWLFNGLPWKDPHIFKFGKPSISMGHLYHGKLLNNQRVSGWWFGTMDFFDFPFNWECHHPN